MDDIDKMNRKESLIYLISCSLNERKPSEEIVNEMDLQEVIPYAKTHTTGVAVAQALKNSKLYQDGKMDTESVSFIRSVIDTAIYRNLLFDEERKKVLRFMEENKIRYMPLKGILLKELYPGFGMREMADNDILYDRRYQKELCEFFKKEGYTVVSIGKTYHDVYVKRPFFNFEMHTQLFSDYFNEKLSGYYGDVFSKLIKDDNHEYGYHFLPNDFYIYIVLHTYKHFKVRGTGIKSLMDIYIYNKVYGKELDRAYIDHELRQFGLAGYEKKMRKLAFATLSNPDTCFDDLERLSSQEKEMLEYILGSGAFGNNQNRIKNEMKNYQKSRKGKEGKIGKKGKLGKKGKKGKKGVGLTGKARYFMSRVFPDNTFYKQHYPLAYRFKILIPFVVMGRTFRVILFERDKLKWELKEMNRFFSDHH